MEPQFNTDKKTPPVNLGILKKRAFVPYRNSANSPIVLNSRASHSRNLDNFSSNSKPAALPMLMDMPYTDTQKNERDRKLGPVPCDDLEVPQISDLPSVQVDLLDTFEAPYSSAPKRFDVSESAPVEQCRSSVSRKFSLKSVQDAANFMARQLPLHKLAPIRASSELGQYA